MTLAQERLNTTKLLIDDLEMWDEFDIRKNQDPQVSVYYNEIIQLINQQIQTGVDWLDTDDAKDYFYGEAEYQQDVFRALEDEWDDILEDCYGSVDDLIEEIYNKGKQKGYSDIKQRIRFTETDKQAIRIARNYNYHLISRLDNDTRHQIKNVITRGVIAGEHPSKIAPKILNVAEEQLEESIFTPKQRATLIARTETSRVQNTGILQTYINEGYTEIKILTAEDNNVCHTCLSYAYEFNNGAEVTYENRGEEKVHNIIQLIEEGYFPPFHPLCRCTYVSVWKSKGQPPENPMVIDLTPNSSVKFLQDFYDFSDTFDVLPYIQLTEDKIPDIFSDEFKQRFLEFDEKIKDAKWEYTYVGNVTTNKLGGIYSDHKQRRVNPKKDIEINNGDELIAVHNHRGHMPFNPNDFRVIFENSDYYVKYLVVHTPTDVFICELKPNAIQHSDEILYELSMGYGEGLLKAGAEDYRAAGFVMDNYKSNKILNKYMSFRRIRK